MKIIKQGMFIALAVIMSGFAVTATAQSAHATENASRNSMTPTIIGTQGDDILMGTSGVDVVYGDTEDYSILTDGGGDLIYGEDGDDQLFGDFRNFTVLMDPGLCVTGDNPIKKPLCSG